MVLVDVVADMGGEVMKIEYVWEGELCDLCPSPFEPTSIRVVRVDELQQWVNDRKLDVALSLMSYNEICAYRLALTQLLDELEVKP